MPGGAAASAPRRACPACARRDGGVVAPDCPICRGEGVLFLGAEGLVHHSRVVLALAVEFHLEASARMALAAQPDARGVAAARLALAAAVTDLVRTGLLAWRSAPAGSIHPSPPDPVRAAVDLTSGYRVGDAARLAAPPVQFSAEERPLGFGGIPGFSAAGYLSYLARSADPMDPLGPSTAEQAITTRRRTYDATVLARAVKESRS